MEEIIETKVLLVGADCGTDVDFEQSMTELKSLAEAAGKQVNGIITQKLDGINKTWYVGSGKVGEIKEYAAECGAEEVIFDDQLSPSQMRNLGRVLELPILDRTKLILDIFALRAKTREAKLQVETARLQYMLPRLVGMREALGRQGGTSGSMSNKGTGETQLELDRRKIERRISELQKELEAISGIRVTQRRKRDKSDICQVALVGYTNAGKSTILNRMVQQYSGADDKTVLEKDMLFATLETSVRLIDTGNRRPFYLADTVGFIAKLPHGLIKAFRSTLMEVQYADLLIHVVDFADEHRKMHMQVTEETLNEIGAGDIPRIVVYNKADKTDISNLPVCKDNQIYLSASQGVGIGELIDLIQKVLYAERNDYKFLFPYQNGGDASLLMKKGEVLEMEYREDGIELCVNCDSQYAEKYDIFRIK
ncbi:MAG: GTPase HflX [Acetatifactor sp.]|nr:GTPase HflX [Acetatifactor sp.]